jgi:enoyl-[acyl-carrier protein] reductase II
MITSPLCELLGIKYPIIQGGMAWVSDASLASTVSNGGGLGIISAMNSPAESSGPRKLRQKK